MTTVPMKPFRVTFEERTSKNIDVMAVAAWQAIEIAGLLYDQGSSAVSIDETSTYAADWSAEPLEIGGAR